MQVTLKAAGYSLMTMFVSCGVGAQESIASPQTDRSAIYAATERPAAPLFEYLYSQNLKRSR